MKYKTKIIIEDEIEYEVEYEVDEYKNGIKIWSLKNSTCIHRENGPAIEWTDGHKAWYKHGKCHREDGPAAIYDNKKEYWLNGKQYYDITSDEEWIKLVPIIDIIT